MATYYINTTYSGSNGGLKITGQTETETNLWKWQWVGCTKSIIGGRPRHTECLKAVVSVNKPYLAGASWQRALEMMGHTVNVFTGTSGRMQWERITGGRLWLLPGARRQQLGASRATAVPQASELHIQNKLKKWKIKVAKTLRYNFG